jgi:hypothetical protein
MPANNYLRDGHKKMGDFFELSSVWGCAKRAKTQDDSVALLFRQNLHIKYSL